MKDALIKYIIATRTPEELALGFLRYEVVRKMHLRAFSDLYRLSFNGRRFDDLVDERISPTPGQALMTLKPDGHDNANEPSNAGGVGSF